MRKLSFVIALVLVMVFGTVSAFAAEKPVAPAIEKKTAASEKETVAYDAQVVFVTADGTAKEFQQELWVKNDYAIYKQFFADCGYNFGSENEPIITAEKELSVKGFQGELKNTAFLLVALQSDASTKRILAPALSTFDLDLSNIMFCFAQGEIFHGVATIYNKAARYGTQQAELPEMNAKPSIPYYAVDTIGGSKYIDIDNFVPVQEFTVGEKVVTRASGFIGLHGGVTFNYDETNGTYGISKGTYISPADENNILTDKCMAFPIKTKIGEVEVNGYLIGGKLFLDRKTLESIMAPFGLTKAATDMTHEGVTCPTYVITMK